MSEEHEPYITSTGQAFEVQRVSRLDARLFKPFRGDGGTALSDALASGKVHADTPVITTRLRDGTTIVLQAHQLTYHHAAQGVCAGEPWMVSF
ncbi:MAG: hypothetical protein ACPG4T_14340 [Nannocystaceae bacterium]